MNTKAMLLVLSVIVTPQLVNAQVGTLYFGADFGSAKIDNRAQEIANDTVAILGGSTTVVQTVRNAATRIFGGYSLNENVDIEVGYIQSQSYKLTITGTTGSTYGNTPYAIAGSVKVSGPDFSVLIRPSKDSGLNDLYLRVGAHNYESKVNVAATIGSSAVSVSSKESGTGLMLGLGYDWTLNDKLKLGVGITQLNKVSDLSNNDVTYLSVGVKARF